MWTCLGTKNMMRNGSIIGKSCIDERNTVPQPPTATAAITMVNLILPSFLQKKIASWVEIGSHFDYHLRETRGMSMISASGV